VAIAVLLWFLIGFYPVWAYGLDRAAQYGDSFGFVNSLFSSIAFAFVVLALLLQMKELHDAAETQAEQGRLQLKQMEIAERTARIQESMRLDSRRTLTMDAFLKISRDSLRLKHALLAWHPDNNKPTLSQMVDQETDRRLKKDFFDAYTELRSNCLSIGLLFDRRGDGLGKAIQDVYAIAYQWISVSSGYPSSAQCEERMNEQIKAVEQAMRPLWEELAPEDRT
jgi:hypothetical protein